MTLLDPFLRGKIFEIRPQRFGGGFRVRVMAYLRVTGLDGCYLREVVMMLYTPSEKILHLDKVLQTHIIYVFSKIFTILVNQQVWPLKPR